MPSLPPPPPTHSDFVRHLLEFYVVENVVFDSGCRLRFPDDPPDGCSWPRTHVDWFHSYAHNEPCRLMHTSMYHDDLGRTHGSSTEARKEGSLALAAASLPALTRPSPLVPPPHVPRRTQNLWALFKSFWSSMAKMTSAHAINFLQFMLDRMLKDLLTRWAVRMFHA